MPTLAEVSCAGVTPAAVLTVDGDSEIGFSEDDVVVDANEAEAVSNIDGELQRNEMVAVDPPFTERLEHHS